MFKSFGSQQLCPLCGSDSNLIYKSGFMSPMSCLACLKKKPEAWERYCEEQAKIHAHMHKRVLEIANETWNKLGYCRWTPRSAAMRRRKVV